MPLQLGAIFGALFQPTHEILRILLAQHKLPCQDRQFGEDGRFATVVLPAGAEP
jgi:hypothetical protein